MSENCAFCGGPVNPFDTSTWKEVVGWVGGPRKDAMTLRSDTKRYAHESCIHKAREGQTPDQPDLFSEAPEPAPDNSWIKEVDIRKVEELFDE